MVYFPEKAKRMPRGGLHGMKEEHMTVSVLIPAYNAAGTLAATLEAVRAQTRPADEIVVCDDGSTDGTAAVAASVPGVRVLRKRNAGAYSAKMDLLAAAAGEAVLFCDADDAPHADWTAHLVGRLEATGADMAVAGVCAGADLGERRYAWPCAEAGVVAARAFFRLQLAHPPGVYSYVPCAAFRRARLTGPRAIRPVPGLQMHEDEVFMLEAARRCRTVAVSPACVYDYVFRPGSLCDVYARNRAADRRHRRQWFLRDAAKFRVSRRPRFLLRALWHALHLLLPEPRGAR